MTYNFWLIFNENYLDFSYFDLTICFKTIVLIGFDMKKKIKISEIDLFDFLIKFWKCKFQVLLILLSSITLSYMTSTQIPKEFKVSTVIPSVQMIKVRLLNDVIDESIVVNFRNLV